MTACNWSSWERQGHNTGTISGPLGSRDQHSCVQTSMQLGREKKSASLETLSTLEDET